MAGIPPAELSGAENPSDTLLVVGVPNPLFWLLTHLPGWEEISKEEAVGLLLEREVRVRYRPLIVEMDRKTIHNEIK